MEEQEEEQIEEPVQVEQWKPIEPGDNRKGLIITIHGILNYATLNKCKVRCFLTDVKKGVIKDEKGVPCSYETDSYE